MDQDRITLNNLEPSAEQVDAPPAYPFPANTEKMLPWAHVAKRLESAGDYWLATTRPDGRPHVTPLWGVWLDNTLYFDGAPTTQWARNLVRNPAATVHLESASDVAILEGTVEDIVTSHEVAARIVSVWESKYGRLMPEPDTSGLFRFRPITARAWSTKSMQDGARWRFAHAR